MQVPLIKAVWEGGLFIVWTEIILAKKGLGDLVKLKAGSEQEMARSVSVRRGSSEDVTLAEAVLSRAVGLLPKTISTLLA